MVPIIRTCMHALFHLHTFPAILDRWLSRSPPFGVCVTFRNPFSSLAAPLSHVVGMHAGRGIVLFRTVSGLRSCGPVNYLVFMWVWVATGWPSKPTVVNKFVGLISSAIEGFYCNERRQRYLYGFWHWCWVFKVSTTMSSCLQVAFLLFVLLPQVG